MTAVEQETRTDPDVKTFIALTIYWTCLDPPDIYAHIQNQFVNILHKMLIYEI